MSDTKENKPKLVATNIPKLDDDNYESWSGRMEVYLKAKKLWPFVGGSEIPSESKRHEAAHLLISHLGDGTYDACVTRDNRDKPSALWTAITKQYASESANNKGRVWLKFM
ncbi:uncharacterized protein PGTG_09652 [Puccinia graminis f. sp. tritici CRL 75-36-700-3]|uniref:DUF4219 domain-containing protein n=1 Tax=Puccinia graminis f. sp. tritici (strain CRL 75-36-700-3 / race SCCL) TaxID=418459 RepID=E3KI14_PUCGT|nr:uncharacterized protein PGTG_09652 [Puccinia graminis f. sp. tritici CRL 75-36-700-3]EFP83939.2 hypothetical protein PGTG_09652 [Puccinia graminis f. sp. tritici CRL 75-36-700-3]